MTDWAIIPDIHADPIRLDASLKAAQASKLAFLGDLIDAGAAAKKADDKAVLERVRGLVDGGRAVAILGNHEVNACLFHRTGKDGVALRSHNDKNKKQHRSFTNAFGFGTEAALSWTTWFLELPLWLELGGLRLVHASWNTADINVVSERRPDGRLRQEDLPEIARKESRFAKAVLRSVTGPEVELPAGCVFHDISGHPRKEVRLAWWRSNATTWREAALSVPDVTELPVGTLPKGDHSKTYPTSAPPVLVGHYKMDGKPSIESLNAACLDYPERPCIYRWRGERALTQEGIEEIAI